MGRVGPGGDQSRDRRELADEAEEGRWKGTGQRLEKEGQGSDAYPIRARNSLRNPITPVRQSGMRQETPIRLGVDQLSQLIYGVLKPRERVMVLLDLGTGLRRGELSGVRWEDISFEDKVLTPKRSIVKQRIG